MIEHKISHLVTALRWLLWLTALIHVSDIVVIFMTDEYLILKIGGELWEQPISDFSFIDQVSMAIIMAIPTVVLLWGLYQMIKLCNFYARGIIFDFKTCLCFKNFSISLVTMAIFYTAVTPLIIFYLWFQNSIPDLPDFTWSLFLETMEIPLIAFGVLIFLVAKIMEISIEHKNELELTI